ncbi:hypothetical protein FNV43_RR05809 [Rhamnella rubrinervis]|uniref:Uncharacterized protein n=1 Tax=Rhamnella rubrinervis TaxID=2594499 RepID=A0A8K0HNP8_9ROSA|nr:hypothetical protein FNV43_RR05809 [Rhamnella rubrinervis]
MLRVAARRLSSFSAFPWRSNQAATAPSFVSRNLINSGDYSSSSSSFSSFSPFDELRSTSFKPEFHIPCRVDRFLGHYQPQQGKPALWELNSDQHYTVGKCELHFADENVRLVIKRSLSDGNILGSDSLMDVVDDQLSSEEAQGGNEGLSDSTPQIQTFKSPRSYCRYAPAISCKKSLRQLQESQFLWSDRIYYDEHDDDCNLSNFVDKNWLSSSGNSCEEETYER